MTVIASTRRSLATLLFLASVVGAPAAHAQVATEDELLAPSHFVSYSGDSIALSGERSIVGAARSGLNASGAATIFRRGANGAWTVESELGSPAPTLLHQFGFDVAIDGDTALVSEPFAHSPTATLAGALHVFERAGTSWTLAQTLFAPTPASNVGFGVAIDLDGDRAVVGAREEGGTGVVHVYERSGGVWGHADTLLAGDAAANDLFGASVRLVGDRLVVGAPLEDAAGVDAGAVYVFELQGSGRWLEVAKVLAPDGGAGDRFGEDVDLDGDRLVGLAPYDETLGNQPGSATVFERQANGSWLKLAKLLAPSAPALGVGARAACVDLHAGRAVVGFPNATGGAWLFEERSGGAWHASVPLRSEVVVPGLVFDQAGIGSAVALDDTSAFVTSPQAGTPSFFGPTGATLRYDLGTLYHGRDDLSLSGGGAQPLFVRGGESAAGDLWVLVGSATGASPATIDPVTGVSVPIVVDGYTFALLAGGGTFTAWFGALDADGAANTTYFVPVGTAPALAGTVLHHAVLVIDTGTFALSFATDAVSVELVP